MSRLPSVKVGERLASLRLGRLRYNSPWTQVLLVAIVCFCSVGMNNAVAGLGAGGTGDIVLSDISNSVLYGVFALAGVISGSITNLLGVTLTLSLGTMGYALYLGSLWSFQVHDTRAFFIVAGGVLGVTSALLWAAQGVVMMAYPLEKDKGRSFSLFWAVFQMGGVVGACITLGIEARSTLPTVSTGVYLTFVIIMLASIFIALFVLSPQYVVRGDGSVVHHLRTTTPREEIRQLVALAKDWRMLALFPMFLISNFMYVYVGSVTAHVFIARARALSSLMCYLGAVIGGVFIGNLLDHLPGTRKRRAGIVLAVVLFLECLTWGGGLAWQLSFSRSGPPLRWDWSHSKAPGVYLLQFGYYFADASYQGLIYFILASMSNDSFHLARMTGFFKAVQSAGAAIAFGIDASYRPYLNELLATFCIILVSLPLAALVVYKTPVLEERVPDHELEDVDGAVPNPEGDVAGNTKVKDLA